MIRFVKGHACGNDFLIVDAVEVSAERQRDCAVKLCARNTGIGADGVEYLQWTGERSGRIRLFNADGSVAEISGNGTRCVAAWMAHERKLGAGDSVSLETDAGPRECTVVKAGGDRFQIASLMGVPGIVPRTVKLSDEEIDGISVSVGNPHFVLFAEDVNFKVRGRSWQEVGREICFHPDFPEQTNVEFVRVISTDEIEIRIFERGVGPTTSSGTGTCATAVAAMVHRGGASRLQVRAPGGTQQVEWLGGESEILLTGPAEIISSGEAFGC
ncbi:diaminopimelate epimerase [Alloacidobacterium dinghuense]|uniref:Diaminopimelate epimerase n=1 Tax=Alloacidobacterium dinghuense TaxID=2763107 RepID=A0A7G8BCY6_9BACT|nr:diaminopimelate epimerase [Alloacidobacterium dinghuense]QNI30406.1 diaminopimelate epimerase [Alloacidobacterium dinghuense]